MAVNNSSNIPSVNSTAVIGTGTGFSTLGYAITPAASTLCQWDANKNLSANNHINGYRTTATATATTTLVVGDAALQYFTGTATQTVVMPVTSTLVLGQTFTIINNSTLVVTVKSSGLNTIQAMAAGTQLVVTVVNTAVTTAAGWNSTYQTLALAAGGIATLAGNSGSATGSTVTLDALTNCGITANFVNSGATAALKISDSVGSQNTILGLAAGRTGYSGLGNTSLGYGTLNSITSASYNTAVGQGSLTLITTGQYNIGIGRQSSSSAAGLSYTSSESSNIVLNNAGVLGESNALRIGVATGTAAGNLNKAFIHGINGVTSSNETAVTINSSTSQLGVRTLTATPTASAVSKWDANVNLSANNLINGYRTTATAAATTTLVVGDSALQFFTGVTTQIVVMPVTSTLVLGQAFTIVNQSTGIVTVNSSGSNLIWAMGNNTSLILICTSLSGTGAASWDARASNQSNTAFLATPTSTVNTITGNNTTYTVTWGTSSLNKGSVLNTSTGVFTAPITGLYQFNIQIGAKAITSSTTVSIGLVTTSQTFSTYSGAVTPTGGDQSFQSNLAAFMTAGDTATVTFRCNGQGADLTGVYSGLANTFWSGYLIGS